MIMRAGLYIHIPFCLKKCGYCDFYSLTRLEQREDFVPALLTEIEILSDQFREMRFDTIFVGGGTPTVLDVWQLEAIWEKLHARFSIDPAGEFSIEANPGTVDFDKLSALRRMGFNRLSLGVQSFFEEDLKFLGRIHSPADVQESYSAARKAGFRNINLDLMTAFPGLTPERFRKTLQTAGRLAPEHISCYTLIFEPGTLFYRRMERGDIRPLDDEQEARFYEMAQQELFRYGYEAYEISNFARGGEYRCQHNLKYWEHQPYLGLGPSAHSFVSPRRWWNVRSLSEYREKLEQGNLPVSGQEILDPETLEFEYIFLHLRLREGIDIADYRRRFRSDFVEKYREVLQPYFRQGILEQKENRLQLTPRGWLLADQVTASF